MRKAIAVAVLAVLVAVTMLFWMLNSEGSVNTRQFLIIAVQIVVLGFAVVFIYKRWKSAREKLPAEDEMSRKIRQRAAATSYYVSIYLWLALMFFDEKIKLERHTLIGAGILGMAVIFALSWLYHNYIRPSND